MKPSRRARRPDPGTWLMRPGMIAGAERSARLNKLLTESGSLTAALQRHGRVTIQILAQTIARPHADERPGLRVRAHEKWMLREVLLCVDGTPWVFAHTVANAQAQVLLARAGRRPLASVLFSDPRVQAKELHYRRINQRHPLFAKARALISAADSPRSCTAFDARRALFMRGRARLLVTEVFLPA